MKTQITAISPIDGRYYGKTRPLSKIMSEYGLIYYRIFVEIKFLQMLSQNKNITECPTLLKSDNDFLDSILTNFNETDALAVKDIEKTTNHDVKAVEYFLKDKFKHSTTLNSLSEFIHFGLTSEDVNNLAYALMVKQCHQGVMLPMVNDIIDLLSQMSKKYISAAMLSRTHGQPASPTTMGKELAKEAYAPALESLKVQMKQAKVMAMDLLKGIDNVIQRATPGGGLAPKGNEAVQYEYSADKTNALFGGMSP